MLDESKEIIETVHEYHREKLVDELAVETWPDRICLTDHAEESPVLAHYDRFRAWADAEDVTLEPAFTRRQRTTLVSDGSDTVLELPVCCLAISVDGELVSVAPHSNGTTYTVGDALADLESLPRGRSPGDLSESPPDHPVRSAAKSRTAEHFSTRKRTTQSS